MSYLTSPMASLLASVGLTVQVIRCLARRSGFCRRSGAKIQAEAFIYTLCELVCQGTASFNDLAAAMQANGLCSVSRQAVAKRVGESFTTFIQSLLAMAMQAKSGPTANRLPECARHFKRIVVQDSTIVSLPKRLMSAFSGVKNATSQVCNARIQAIYDLKAGSFLGFSIDSYARNDLLAALDYVPQAGDLSLRDRGYHVLESIMTIIAAGAHLICRYKHGVNLLDPSTGKCLDLLAILRREKKVDRIVCLSDIAGPRLRLVAVRVNKETANLRRMRLKRETKGHKPSATLLALCDWVIYLTTLTDPAISMTEIQKLYGLRWRIECIFKSWKSHFNFAQLHQVSAEQARSYLSARLLVITLMYHQIWAPLSQRVAKHSTRILSMLKFTRYITKNPQQIPLLLRATSPQAACMKALVRYCSYDKRKRPNYEQEFHYIYLQINALEKIS